MTQLDLLNEGFWDKFKSVTKGAMNFGKNVAKGAAVLGKFGAKQIAPSLYNQGKNMVDATKKLNQDVIQATTPITDYLKKKYEEQGYIKVRVEEIPKRGTGDKQWYKVTLGRYVFDRKTQSKDYDEIEKIVDEEGNENAGISALVNTHRQQEQEQEPKQPVQKQQSPQQSKKKKVKNTTPAP